MIVSPACIEERRVKENQMRRFVIGLAAMLGLAIVGHAPAAMAKTICSIQAVEASSKGHRTGKGAVARAWVNWQGKMRNVHGRRFSVALARSTRGFPKRQRNGRFNHAATVRAQGCYVKRVSCVTGSGITPVCECQPDRRAALRQGCDVYAPGRR